MAEPGWWPRLKARWKDMMAEYGTVALVTWFTLFGLTVFGFGMAIEAGMSPGEVLGKLGMDPARASTVGSAGKWGIAYGLTQLTKPVRLVIVLAITPLVARLWHRITGKRAGLPAGDAPKQP